MVVVKNDLKDKDNIQRRSMKKKEYIFTEKEIENFAGIYNALQQVYIRLIKEGYEIKDGKITPPDKPLKGKL